MSGPRPLRFPAKESLEDDGDRDWDKSVEDDLDKRYPEWRAPRNTTLINQLTRNQNDRSNSAEQKLVDLFGEMGNVEGKEEPMFITRSHLFWELAAKVPATGAAAAAAAAEKEWIIGENDIVVLHRKFGPIFFQVKSGATKKEYKNAETQILKDQRAAAAFLRYLVDEGCLRRDSARVVFKFPGFVAMPNCSKELVKKTGRRGLFKEDLANVDTLRAWWDENVASVGRPDGYTEEVYVHLVKRFVGWCVAWRSDEINKTCERLEFFTRDQLRVMLSSCPKQWITGPAGCGKTWLLEQKVLELATKSLIHDDEISQSILVVCSQSPMAKNLEDKFQEKLKDHLARREITRVSSVIKVMTYDEFVQSCLQCPILGTYSERAGPIVRKHNEMKKKCEPPCSFDHIFLDEAQDFYGIKWPEIFELCLKKTPGDRHYFWVMYDSHQVADPLADPPMHFEKHLCNAYHLTEVIRNPQNVFSLSKMHFRSSFGQEIKLAPHNVQGMGVEWVDSLPDADDDERVTEGSKLVAEKINELLKEKVKPNDICVLTVDEQIRDNLSVALSRKDIPCQDAEHQPKSTESEKTDMTLCVTVESIVRFKGLESKVVILFDPTSNTKTRQQLNALLYVGMSRCCCLLIVVSSKLAYFLVHIGRFPYIKSMFPIHPSSVSAERQGTYICSWYLKDRIFEHTVPLIGITRQ